LAFTAHGEAASIDILPVVSAVTQPDAFMEHVV